MENTPATTQARPVTPVDRLKTVIAEDSVQAQFRNALAEGSGLFVASLIDVYASDTYLQKCDPKLVVMEALKAATLKLPINKSLGFAYIVPYNKKRKDGNKWVTESIPQFQVGYKGYIQLAMRTGQYRFLNAGTLYDGHAVEVDLLTGQVKILGRQKSDKAIGYFAYMELINGFSKAVFWTKEQVSEHAKKFSKSYGMDSSPWNTQFDAMATKTMIRNLLGKYGVMSVDMVSALSNDSADDQYEGQTEADENASQIMIDIEPQEPQQAKKSPTPTPITGENGPPPIDEAEARQIAADEAAAADDMPDWAS